MKRTPIKRKYTDEYVKKLGEKLLIWIKDASNLWLGTFAAENSMSRARLQEIASVNDHFNSIYEEAKQIQENKLVVGALSKKIDVTMAIFSLKNVAGWRDKQELEHFGELNFNFNLNGIVSNSERQYASRN